MFAAKSTPTWLSASTGRSGASRSSPRPDRESIGTGNILVFNFNGGGIHCQSQQEPKIKPFGPKASLKAQ